MLLALARISDDLKLFAFRTPIAFSLSQDIGSVAGPALYGWQLLRTERHFDGLTIRQGGFATSATTRSPDDDSVLHPGRALRRLPGR
jgi:hypothetical protein